MTITMKSEIETGLVVSLAEGFQRMKFSNDYCTPSDFAWSNNLLNTLDDDARGKVQRYLGDQGFARLIAETIRHTAEASGQAIKRNLKLMDLPLASEPITLARRLVAELKRVPIRYRVTVALPIEFSDPIAHEAQDEFSFPSEIKVQKGTLLDKLTLRSRHKSTDRHLFRGLYLPGGEVERSLNPEQYYLSMPVLGFVAPYSSSSVGRDFEDNLRAFYGAARATKLIETTWRGETATSPFLLIHNTDQTELLATELLEEDLRDQGEFVSTEAFASAHNADIWSAFQLAMNRISTIFNNNLDCRRLFIACIWFYRAHINLRPLDALLQATISIEVMLGDRKAAEGVGLANLLGSRCAFLLGTSSTERESIMANFRTIYALRSAIVHEGRHTLSSGDESTVNLALSMCAAIISKELVIRSNA